MAKDPAFLFYTKDFQTGTQFFTDEQVGKYIRLLVAQHQHGHLTENQVIHICKSYDNHVMSKFLKDSEGKWYNERLDIEIDKRKKYSESRANNKRGKKIIQKSYDSHMVNADSISVLDDNTINSLNIKEGAKSQFPAAETFEKNPSESDYQKAIEIYYRQKGILLSMQEAQQLFEIFKLKNLTGKKFYQDDSEVIGHFKNWITTQQKPHIEINDTTGRKSANIYI